MPKPTNEKRPAIVDITTSSELKRWYWLKDELTAQARNCGVKTSGAKFVILDRLAYFLETGNTVWPGDKVKSIKSNFDWHKELLTPQTLITDSYKNSQNVRRFFQQYAGENFKFNIAFMDWIKNNIGKTLGDAVEVYNKMQTASAKPGFQTKIQPHNQFNQYTRDILNANPHLGMGEVRRIWALKWAMPTIDGRHVYEPDDLDLT